MKTDWQIATLVKSEMCAENVRSMTFLLPRWQKHMAGQHYDLRLTAPNGYQAERSYSVASAPEEEGTVQFGIQILPDGEVSPYLNALAVGRQIEMRGPLGGHFVWDTSMPGPLVLVAGGSGMVPLMAMLRHQARHMDTEQDRDVVFLISARTMAHVLWKEELDQLAAAHPKIKVTLTLTDKTPEHWTGYRRRLDKEMVQEVFGHLVGAMPMIYICGPTGFVEAAAKHMRHVGFNSHEIKTERFGG